MIAFKLFRKLKNGELRPLFIDKKRKLITNFWLDADLVETKGYKVRKGWHCLPRPKADHLSKKNRVWCVVEILDVEEIKRPEKQGGKWYLAQHMKILGELPKI
tara:strand:- start:186 stop:494 length:309 start_codon:yes stop_codon:yes gene_type:complete